jgi:hypothetical protein
MFASYNISYCTEPECWDKVTQFDGRRAGSCTPCGQLQGADRSARTEVKSLQKHRQKCDMQHGSNGYSRTLTVSLFLSCFLLYFSCFSFFLSFVLPFFCLISFVLVQYPSFSFFIFLHFLPSILIPSFSPFPLFYPSPFPSFHPFPFFPSLHTFYFFVFSSFLHFVILHSLLSMLRPLIRSILIPFLPCIIPFLLSIISPFPLPSSSFPSFYNSSFSTLFLLFSFPSFILFFLSFFQPLLFLPCLGSSLPLGASQRNWQTLAAHRLRTTILTLPTSYTRRGYSCLLSRPQLTGCHCTCIFYDQTWDLLKTC